MAFAGGTGIVNDPYLVSTPEQLNDVRNYLNSSFKQINDIDLSSYSNWTPIAFITYFLSGTLHFRDSTKMFHGVYDGGNFKISNMTINSSTVQGVGLFGSSKGALFKNINLVNVNITSTTTVITFTEGTDKQFAGQEVGALVGYAEDTNIDNCSSTGVINCYGGEYVGGLIGWLEQKTKTVYYTISNSWSSMNINSLYNASYPGYSGLDRVGGFVGFTEGGYYSDGVYNTITNCYATGNISFIDSPQDTDDRNYIENAGGFIGEMWGGLTEKCYSTGSVQACWLSGGFIGQGADGLIQNCYSRGNVNLPSKYPNPNSRYYNTYGDFGDFGGFGGELYWGSSMTLTNCYCTGTVPLGNGTDVTYNTSGFSYYNQTIENNCFYDITLSPTTDPLALGKSTTEMKTQSTFINWDFSTPIWYLNDNNDGYPCFVPGGNIITVFVKELGVWQRADNIYIKESGTWY